MDWMLLPFRRYFDFSGRSRRKEYWMFVLLLLIVYALAGGLMFSGGLATLMAGGASGLAFSPAFWIGAGVAGIFVLFAIIPSVAVTVRRLHDRNLSGWWYLGIIVLSALPKIGFVGNIALLVLMCLPGDRGANRFGPDPLDPTNAEVFA